MSLSITTEDLVLRLRELLERQLPIQRPAEEEANVGLTAVASGSRNGSSLWETAAAAVTSEASVMVDLDDRFTVLARQPSAPVMSSNSTIGQAILSVLQGIRPNNFSHPQDWTRGESPSWNTANWTLPDFDLKSFVEAGGGDDGVGIGSAAIIATAYALVMAVSLFGNLLVCYVVFRHRRLRSVTYTFLVNVALSDLLMTCLNIPFSVSRVLLDHWPFGDFLCSLVPFVQAMSVYVSSLTMAAIAVDRYRVILTPLKRRLRPPHGLVIMVVLWILASMAALPYAMYSEVVPIFTYRPLRRCQARFPTPALEFRRYLTIITFVTQYVIPLSVSGLAYGAIVRRLWMRSFVGAVTDAQRERQDRAKRKTIQMLLVVVSLFALCWLPLNVYHLVSDVGASVSVTRHNSTAFLICHWLAMSSVCYNPFVYCWLNANFRDAVKTCGRVCLRSVWFARGRKQQPSIIMHNTTAIQPESTTNTGLSARRQDSIRSVKLTPHQLLQDDVAAPTANEETSLV